jgi:hypothetical protein
VKYSPALKWWLIVMLPLTIAWKVAIKQEDPVEVQNAIVEFLTAHNFAVRTSDEGLEYTRLILATSPSCELRVARISPLGHEAELVRQVTAAGDHTFYLFRGRVYQEQPVRLTVMNYLWYRFLRELGVATRVPPVLAVMSSCDAERLPWGALRGQQPM